MCTRHASLAPFSIEVTHDVKRVNVCVDWPLLALPTTITGDYHPPETPKVYHRVSKCKFSKCRIAYYPNATTTRRILLLSGAIEVNPGWENGPKKFDPTHVSNN